jgi:hypothetical protein
VNIYYINKWRDESMEGEESVKERERGRKGERRESW